MRVAASVNASAARSASLQHGASRQAATSSRRSSLSPPFLSARACMSMQTAQPLIWLAQMHELERARRHRPVLGGGAERLQRLQHRFRQQKRVLFVDDEPLSVLGFAIAGGKIVELDILADPARLARLPLSAIRRPPATG